MDKRLFRNGYDKVIAGVSSGVADYMQVDVTIIRLLFVLSTIFLFGTGILVYIIMWIVVPVNYDPSTKFSKFNDYLKGPHGPSTFNSPNAWTQPHQTPGSTTEPRTETKVNDPYFGNTGFSNESFTKDFKTYPKPENTTGRTVGGLVLLVIGLFFLMNEFDIVPYWFNITRLWPLVLVAIGLSFILKSKRNNDFETWKREQQEPATGEPEQPTNVADGDVNNKP